jgi:hypothetical protein
MARIMKKPIQSNEGIDDLNIIMNELAKNTPNKQKIRELTHKYGIHCSNDPKILISDIICFLDHQKFDKLTDTES